MAPSRRKAGGKKNSSQGSFAIPVDASDGISAPVMAMAIHGTLKLAHL